MRLLNRRNKKTNNHEPYTSWATTIKLYTKFRIPWLMLLLLFLSSIGLKEAESQLVPYTSAIETAAIDKSGWIWGFILITLIYGLIEALYNGILDWANALTQRNVRRSVWKKMIQLPMSTYDKEDPQRFVSRITQDTTNVFGGLSTMVQFISLFYGMYTNFMGMYQLNRRIALMMLTTIPLSLLTAWVCGKLEYSINKIRNNAYSVITNFFGERLPNLLHIKTSSMEDKEYEAGVKANNERYKADIKILNRFIFQSPLPTFIGQYLNMIILLVMATAMVRAGSMTQGAMVNIYNYFLLFGGNAVMISAVWQGLKGTHGGCQVIARIIDTEDEKLDGLTHVKGENSGDLIFDNVHFSYDGGKEILKGISFVIPEGKTTAIVGENGSGKSTIIKLLERFNSPSSGTIRLGNNDLQDLNLYEWRNAVGYLFQGDQIVKGSIRDNICYGADRDYTEEDIINAAKKARAYDFIMAREEGFDTQISRFDSKLSGGELQRIAIARIILKQPDYLILDEATSGIDAVSEKEVLAGLKEMMKGKTVIMVSHDMNLIRRADHIVVLNDGRIEASGDYAHVTEQSRLFNRFMLG